MKDKDKAEPFADSEIPLFDVFVKIPPNTNFEDAKHMVHAVPGLTPDHAEKIVNALRNGPQVKIGTGVSAERANKAKVQFTSAGLVVVVSPVLVLQTMMAGAFDGLFVCPACNGRFVLPQNRQCPDCGVFVDKVTEEFLLKRKIMEQERAKLTFQADRDTKESVKLTRQAMEAAIRAQVRKELEAEFGRSEGAHFFSGKAGLLRATGMISIMALAFFGGNAMPQSIWLRGKTENLSKSSKPVDVDVVLAQIAPTTPGSTTDALSATGDPYMDDLLTQTRTNHNGKSLTLDQALAAANTLGKALGNTTAERAWAGSGAAPATGTVASPESVAAPVSARITATTPPHIQWMLTAEFAKQLAALGQWQRALDILKTLKTVPNLEAAPLAAAAVRRADLEVQAWAIGSLGESHARKAAEALKSATTLADPVERAQALGRVAAILSHHTQLPVAVPQAFLTLAGEALKSVPDINQRAAGVNDWMINVGEVLSAEITLHAKAGMWSKAKAASLQFDGLRQQPSSDSTKARLYAMDAQIRQKLGQPEQGTESLRLALSTTRNEASPATRATLLRAIAQLSEAAALEPVQAAVQQLVAQLESQSGIEKAQALTQLALLHAETGMRTKADQYSRMARETTGVAVNDASMINADLIVRGHMATAVALHRQGRYAESEFLIKSLADYLL